MFLFTFSAFSNNNNKTNVINKNNIEIQSSRYVEATLTNEEYNHQLFLYNNGKCVIRTSDARGTGTYNIEGSSIYITWDNGEEQQGRVSFEQGQLKSVSIEGVTYSRRLVLHR